MSILKGQLNNDSVTDELLILALQKFEEDQGRYLGNDKNNKETDKTLFKKNNQMMTVQLMRWLSLNCKKLK